MKKVFLIIIALVAVGIAAFYFISKNQYDFNLRSAFKEQTTLEDFKGKKLIVYFGYTFCPDICPSTLSLIGRNLKTLKDPKAHVLFISLDISRDGNLTSTNEWLRYFYPNADALIAKDDSVLKKVAKNYGVQYKKIDINDSVMKYSVAHSSEIFLIDENGKLQKVIRDLNPEEVAKELKIFLSSK
ncbi:SCO family protein [Campylobacter coli]|nr:SCO family protein [Campylobacter coli]